MSRLTDIELGFMLALNMWVNESFRAALTAVQRLLPSNLTDRFHGHHLRAPRATQRDAQRTRWSFLDAHSPYKWSELHDCDSRTRMHASVRR